MHTVGISVQEVLELELLRRASPRVVAGRDELDREVRWVHVAELPDIAHLLRGGELLLTTGMGIAGSSDRLQRRYVAELADAGIAGVVVELGRNFDRLPDALVEAAGAHHLPLIALGRETRYVEVTETVHRAIVNRQYELLRRAEQVSRELTELVASGAQLDGIVGQLAEIFDNHVVLEDEAHQVVEIAGLHTGTGELLASWAQHARLGHDEVERGRVHRHDGARRCMWVGLWLRHDRWGRLHVLETKSRLDEMTELLVERAGAALRLALLSERDAAHLADRARSAVIGELVAGRHGGSEALVQRASSLGEDLSRGRLAALALETTTTGSGLEEGDDEDHVAGRAALAEVLRTAAKARGCAALVGLVGEGVLAVLAVPGTRPLSSVLEEIVDDALERHGDVSVVAGASGEARADSVHRALDEAVAAVGMGRRDIGAQRLHHFSDFGTHQLLLKLARGPDLARFVESELRKLLDHDSRTNAALLPTLRAYLAHAGRKADAVRTLGIQRRTLYARLGRIEGLVGRNLDDQDTRTRLALALQGLDLLQDRRARRGD